MIINDFSVKSVTSQAISYYVAIHDTKAVGHDTSAVGIVIRGGDAPIATVLGWLTPEGNIAAPDLNVADLGAINIAHMKLVPSGVA